MKIVIQLKLLIQQTFADIYQKEKNINEIIIIMEKILISIKFQYVLLYIITYFIFKENVPILFSGNIYDIRTRQTDVLPFNRQLNKESFFLNIISIGGRL